MIARSERAIRSVVLILILVGLIAPSVAAQQPPYQIRIAPRESAKTTEQSNEWFPQAVETLAGNIQVFDANQIAILIPGASNPNRYLSNRVVEIRLTSTPEPQQQAIDAFLDGQYTDALKGFVTSVSKTAPEDRPPVWRQQWLSMMAAQSAFRSGRGEIALEIVGQLDARPMPALILGLLPIDWTGSVLSRDQADALVEVAAKRASSQSPAVKLVAASWLLRSPKYRDVAAAAAERLAGATQRKTVAMLAGQLKHRVVLPTDLREKWRLWRDEIETLPMSVQTGPLISLEYQCEQAGLDDPARELRLLLQHAAPGWHPDLPN